MMKKYWLLLLALLIMACNDKDKQQVSITFNSESNRVTFNGLDAAIINQLQRDSADTKSWQALLPVYKMPADTDLKDFQSPMPGRYLVRDTVVLFTPDTAFLRGKTYFARFYNFSAGNSGWDIIKNRQKPGKKPYQETIFSY